MRTIKIDDEVYRALQERAIAFEDTPNDVLRKLLDLNRASAIGSREDRYSETRPDEAALEETMAELGINGTRLSRSALSTTPKDEYIVPILESLLELGGRAEAKDVLRLVFEKMMHRLTQNDLEEVPSGTDKRWHKAAMWARYLMVKKGLLENNSPRGIWEISEDGRAYLGNVANEPR